MSRKQGTKTLVVAAAALCVLSAPAQAMMTDPLIEGAKLCTRHLPRYERQYGIPVHLLSAISSTETGRWHSGLKIAVPWPWTINAEGKGYYFDTKQEAIAAARRLQARGVRSMDVGCMQVNLLHHPDAFADLEYAFDPESNIAYAASFLSNLYRESGSWKKAASDYHSRTVSLGQQYVGRVFTSWHNIIDKVRDARTKTQIASAEPSPRVLRPHEDTQNPNVMNMAAGDTSLPVAQPVLLDEASLAQAEQAGLPQRPSLPQAPQRLSEQEGRNVKPHEQPHMRVIKVASNSRKGRRDAGVIVVRPDVEEGQMAVSALTTPNAGFDVEPYVKPAEHRDSTLTVTPMAREDSALTMADASQMIAEKSPAAIAVNPQPQAVEPSIPAFEAVVPKVLDVKRMSSRQRGPNFIFSD